MRTRLAIARVILALALFTAAQPKSLVAQYTQIEPMACATYLENMYTEGPTAPSGIVYTFRADWAHASISEVGLHRRSIT